MVVTWGEKYCLQYSVVIAFDCWRLFWMFFGGVAEGKLLIELIASRAMVFPLRCIFCQELVGMASTLELDDCLESR